MAYTIREMINECDSQDELDDAIFYAQERLFWLRHEAAKDAQEVKEEATT